MAKNDGTIFRVEYQACQGPIFPEVMDQIQILTGKNVRFFAFSGYIIIAIPIYLNPHSLLTNQLQKMM